MRLFSPKAKRIPKTANRDDDYGGEPSPPEEEESSRRARDHCEFETTENCHLLEKTLSMNDDLMLEMNSYPDERSPMMVIADSRTIETTSPLVTICALRTNRVAESVRFTIPWRSEDKRKRISELAEDARSSPDRRDSFGSSTRKSVSRQNDELGAPNLDRKRLKRTNNDRHFDAAAKRVGERLAANWREFRKTFAHLLRGLDGKIREKDVERNASLLSRSKDFVVDREFCHSPVSSFVSLLSPRNCCENASTTGRNVVRTFLASEEARQSDESPRRRAEDVVSKVHQGSVTPYSGSSPSARRCRTTLKFEDEEAQKQSTADTRDHLQITNSLFLPVERKGEEHSAFSPPNPSACDKARLESHDSLRLISRSTSICDLDLPMLPEHRNKSLQEVKYQNDLHDCTCCAQGNTETLHNSREHVPRRRSVPCAVIFGFTAFCLWLIQKLLHLLNSGYERLRRAIVPSSSSEIISSQSPRTKELGLLVATLRSDNERMLYMLSEKVNRLSADFIQVRTSTETTINALTAEIREIGRKVKENNMLLMQELKNLQEKLEEIRLNSMRTTPLSSSPPQPPPSPAVASVLIPPPPPLPPSSSLPPPPPPPLPPPPSSLLFPQRKHISVSPMRPLLSALPSVPLQSPTTPNSTRNNRSRVTPTRKCSTPLLNRPSITVEDLLQVTLKKPQSIKDNRWNTMPNPRGPVVSLDMLRSVKLKSVRRRTNDQTGRSPRRRVIKGRNAPSLTLSPIMTASEGNLERILRQVDANRRNPRRLMSSSISFREHNFTSDEMQQSVEMLKHSQSSQSVIA